MNIFKRLKEGLSKTRQNIVAGFDNIFSGHKAINDDFYDELEEVMIMGDMGVRATEEILDELKDKVKAAKIKDPEECRSLLIETIKEKIDLGENAYDYENQKSALLIIGVNGVGKTTSVGKLAASLSGKGRKVLLAAADTFRAGAIDQLKIWGERAGVPVIAQNEGADPGAVIYDAVQSAKAKDVDVLIADTAGRLHNKKNLMNELSKIDRIIEREYPDVYRENLIVLDATTGQNALMQLKEFKEVADITGIILTKMDGTAKGGIIIAIQAEYGIPVKYIGVGEKIQDLQKFNSDAFVNALFDVEIPDDDYYSAEVEEDDVYEQGGGYIPAAYMDEDSYEEEVAAVAEEDAYVEEQVTDQNRIPEAYKDEDLYEEEVAAVAEEQVAYRDHIPEAYKDEEPYEGEASAAAEADAYDDDEQVADRDQIPEAYKDEDLYEEEIPTAQEETVNFEEQTSQGQSQIMSGGTDDEDMIDLDDFLGEDGEEEVFGKSSGNDMSADGYDTDETQINETADVPEHREASFADLENLGHGLSFEELYGLKDSDNVQDISARSEGSDITSYETDDRYFDDGESGQDNRYYDENEDDRDDRYYDDDEDDRDDRYYDDDEDDRDDRYYDDDEYEDYDRPKKKKRGLFGLFRR